MIQEKPKKSEVLKQSRQALSERNKILKTAKDLEDQYTKLAEKYQPEIDQLQQQADALAQKFKSLYQEASDAYNSGDRASAKSLSVQGHNVEDECKSLNQKANARREELKRLQNTITQLYEQSRSLKLQADDCRRQAQQIRSTMVVNFQVSGVTSEEEIEGFLDQFPEKIFKNLEFVTYVHEQLFEETGTTKTPSRGFTVLGSKGKDTIRIGKQSGKTDNIRRKNTLETIAHEIGHVVYRKFLTDDQKATWYSWDAEAKDWIDKYAFMNDEESFAQSLGIFKTQPKRLKKFNEKMYTFINEIHSKLGEKA